MIDLARNVVDYYIDNESTVRKTAQAFGISKSLVYYYLTKIYPNAQSMEILKRNKAEKHIRGGEATKQMYQKKRSQ